MDRGYAHISSNRSDSRRDQYHRGVDGADWQAAVEAARDRLAKAAEAERRAAVELRARAEAERLEKAAHEARRQAQISQLRSLARQAAAGLEKAGVAPLPMPHRSGHGWPVMARKYLTYTASDGRETDQYSVAVMWVTSRGALVVCAVSGRGDRNLLDTAETVPRIKAERWYLADLFWRRPPTGEELLDAAASLAVSRTSPLYRLGQLLHRGQWERARTE
jgi:hypothetical protein